MKRTVVTCDVCDKELEDSLPTPEVRIRIKYGTHAKGRVKDVCNNCISKLIEAFGEPNTDEWAQDYSEFVVPPSVPPSVTVPNVPWAPQPSPYIGGGIGSHYDTCSCNPKNGGSGVCNCTVGGPTVTASKSGATYRG